MSSWVKVLPSMSFNKLPLAKWLIAKSLKTKLTQTMRNDLPIIGLVLRYAGSLSLSFSIF